MNKILKTVCVLAEDDELLLLSIAHALKHHFFKEKKFDLEDFSPEECKQKFRFQKEDIYRLETALSVAKKVICRNRTVCSGKYLKIVAYLSFLQTNNGQNKVGMCKLSSAVLRGYLYIYSF